MHVAGYTETRIHPSPNKVGMSLLCSPGIVWETIRHTSSSSTCQGTVVSACRATVDWSLAWRVELVRTLKKKIKKNIYIYIHTHISADLSPIIYGHAKKKPSPPPYQFWHIRSESWTAAQEVKLNYHPFISVADWNTYSITDRTSRVDHIMKAVLPIRNSTKKKTQNTRAYWHTRACEWITTKTKS